MVALGGDGLMLQTLRRLMKAGKPIYGMHRGTVGFLMNDFREKGLRERLAGRADHRHPPAVDAGARHQGQLHEHYAINEVSLFRQTYQVARLAHLRRRHRSGCPSSWPTACWWRRRRAPPPTIFRRRARSSRSTRRSWRVTPISPFRPRRWRGALLPDAARVTIRVIDPERRPVAAVADHAEVRSVREVDIRMDHSISMQMLFDPGHSLDERILREQFGY